MLTPVILGIGLLLATAVIAYWSDNLGKKLGKKRVSIFGLRPRQTATIITIVSSWCIMLVTVLALLAVYAPLRNALLHYDQERAANLQLRSDKKELDSSVAQLNRQQSTLKGEVKSSQLAASKARKALQRTAKSLKTARRGAQTARKAELNARRNETRARLAAATARRNQAAARRRETVARRNETVAQRRARLASANYEKSRKQLDEATSQVILVGGELAAKRTDVNRLQQDAARLRKDYVKGLKDRVRLLKDVAGLRNERDKIGNELVAVQNDLKMAQSQVTELETKARQLEAVARQLEAAVKIEQARYESAEAVNERISTGQIVVPYGLTFASRTIAPRLGREAVLSALNELLQTAKAEARKIGSLSLGLALQVETEGRRVQLGEQEVLGLLANYVMDFEFPASVRVIAARDYAEGETEIIARMVPVKVRPALSRGEVLARATIEGSERDAKIFSELYAMIGAGRLYAARQRGVEPPISRDSPNFFASDTNDQIFEAMDRIKTLREKGGRISVRLVAADDLSTIESPRVKFEVGTSA